MASPKQLTDIPVKCTRRSCGHEHVESERIPMVVLDGSATPTGCPKCGRTDYFDMRPQVAWCWASGLIEIGAAVPRGAILIARGPLSSLKPLVSGRARRGRGESAGKLLVPGVPEAASQQEAVDALDAWLKWCAKGNGNNSWSGVEFITTDSRGAS